MAGEEIVTRGVLGPEFRIGSDVAGQITLGVDGVTIFRDPATGTISARQATFSNDPTLTGGDYSADTGLLVLHFDNSTDVTIALGSFLTGTPTELTDVFGRGLGVRAITVG